VKIKKHCDAYDCSVDPHSGGSSSKFMLLVSQRSLCVCQQTLGPVVLVLNVVIPGCLLSQLGLQKGMCSQRHQLKMILKQTALTDAVS
jgi:hypothetical protein